MKDNESHLAGKLVSDSSDAMQTIKIIYWAILGTFSAWLHLYRGRLELVSIPPVHETYTLTDKQTCKLVVRVEKLIKRIILRLFKTKHICFYRSIVLISIFRRLGLPLSLNIGMKNLHDRSKTGGHCWLSLNDEPFYEDQKTLQTYPVFLGKNRKGIAYWVAETKTT